MPENRRKHHIHRHIIHQCNALGAILRIFASAANLFISAVEFIRLSTQLLTSQGALKRIRRVETNAARTFLSKLRVCELKKVIAERRFKAHLNFNKGR